MPRARGSDEFKLDRRCHKFIKSFAYKCVVNGTMHNSEITKLDDHNMTLSNGKCFEKIHTHINFNVEIYDYGCFYQFARNTYIYMTICLLYIFSLCRQRFYAISQ